MADSDESRLAREIGKAIAKKRGAAGFTQEQVAEQLGIGLEAVSRMERGLVVPTVARLAELADIFECNVADLLTLASNRANDQALHLSRTLAKLNASDRTLIVEMVEQLATRLGRR